MTALTVGDLRNKLAGLPHDTPILIPDNGGDQGYSKYVAADQVDIIIAYDEIDGPGYFDDKSDIGITKPKINREFSAVALWSNDYG